MQLRNFGSLIFTLSALIAMGTGCSKSDPAPSDTNWMPAQNLSQAQQLASEAVVHCTDSTQCSPSVGMLIGTTDTSAYQCTTFLIAPNIAATNSHCIPDDLKTAQSNCQGRIEVLFPALGQYGQVTAGCNQVLTASQIDTTFKNPDYAFIQLDTSVSRPALSISHEGLANNSIYTLTKIDPYQGNGIPEGYMHQDHCKAIYDSAIAPGSNFPQAPVVTVGDCTVVHGNSGSPLLDSTGNVPAIVFATVDQSSLGSLLTQLENIGSSSTPTIIGGGSAAPLGLATNYACVQLPGEALASSQPQCQSGYVNTSDNSNQTLEQQMNTEVQSKFAQIKDTLNPSMSWTLNSIQGKEVDTIGLITDDTYSLMVVPVPQCVLDYAQFLSQDKKDLLGAYESKSDRTSSLPLWSIQIGFNSYYQTTYQITEAPSSLESEMMLQYDPDSLYRTGKSSIDVSDALDLELGKPLYSGDLGPCPNDKPAK